MIFIILSIIQSLIEAHNKLKEMDYQWDNLILIISLEVLKMYSSQLVRESVEKIARIKLMK